MDDLPEVDHHGPESHTLHEVRELLVPTLELLTDIMHVGVIPEGHQWTIPIHMSCGLSGAVILRLDDLGTCNART